MFKYAPENNQQLVTVTLDGAPVSLPAGMNVAAALLGMGEIISRISPASHNPCSPHCLMGVCYECLMEINGVNRQACMTPVSEGMVIRRHLTTGPEEMLHPGEKETAARGDHITYPEEEPSMDNKPQGASA